MIIADCFDIKKLKTYTTNRNFQSRSIANAIIMIGACMKRCARGKERQSDIGSIKNRNKRFSVVLIRFRSGYYVLYHRGCPDRCSLSRQGTTSSPFLGEQHNVPSSVRRPDRNRNLPLARSIRKNDLIRMRKQETENARPKKR